MLGLLLLATGSTGVYDGTVEYNCDNMYDSFSGTYEAPEAPGSVTDLVATDGGYKQIVVSWTPSIVNPLPTYDLYENDVKILSSVSSGVSITREDTTVRNYYVIGTNSIGSSQSNADTGSAIITALQLTLPSSDVPLNLTSFIDANNPSGIEKVEVTNNNANYPAISSGDLDGYDVLFINNGSIEGSSGSGTALSITASIELENNGYIKGAGGGGGTGGKGGTAIYTKSELRYDYFTYYVRAGVEAGGRACAIEYYYGGDKKWRSYIRLATGTYTGVSGATFNQNYDLDSIVIIGDENSDAQTMWASNDRTIQNPYGDGYVTYEFDTKQEYIDSGASQVDWYSIKVTFPYYKDVDYGVWGGNGGAGGTGQYYNVSAGSGVNGFSGTTTEGVTSGNGGRGGDGGIWGTNGSSGTSGTDASTGGSGFIGLGGNIAGKAISGKSNITNTTDYGNTIGEVV